MLEGLEPVRRRPGMYIGGTDEKALHHLFAEVIDNAMDEALAGHATFIEVELGNDGYMTVTDNGRGIPVDPHPKFPKKSALEVIMCTLHAGGKFDSKVYETSGGLHGVGVSVVNALSEKLEVEVARGQQLFKMTFARGKPKGALEKLGRAPNKRGTTIRFKPDAADFRRRREMGSGAAVPHDAREGVSVRRRRDPLVLPERIAQGRRERSGERDPAFPRRPEGLSRLRSRESHARASRHFLRAFGEKKRAWFGGMGGRLHGRRRSDHLVLLQHDPDA